MIRRVLKIDIRLLSLKQLIANSARLHLSYTAPVMAVDPWSQKIEPEFQADPELAHVLDELAAREPIFHRVELGTSRADFEKMMVEGFWEVGASGRRYSKDQVLDVLEKRYVQPHDDVWETKEFHLRKLEENTYLLTYTLAQDNARITRRATVWQKAPDGWKIVYHQGTLVNDV